MESELGDELLVETALEHYQGRRFAQAERLCREALVRNPEDATAANLLGLLAGQAGQIEAGEELLAEAIRLSPEHARYHNDLGLLLSGVGRASEAAALFEKAIQAGTERNQESIERNEGQQLASGRAKPAASKGKPGPRMPDEKSVRATRKTVGVKPLRQTRAARSPIDPNAIDRHKQILEG
ncbi:MAG TPA: tetratricopeptide repeat protein [Tepidisphaeraceae bacterium]|jgi:Tfp pilus assembly protein PilF